MTTKTRADVRNEHLALALGAATTTGDGSFLLPLVTPVVKHIGALLAWHPSFIDSGTPDDTALDGLHNAIVKAGITSGGYNWGVIAKKPAKGRHYLRQIVVYARTIIASEGAALAKLLATATPAAVTATTAPPPAPADSAALRAMAGALYTEAEDVHKTTYAADERVKYEMVAKINRGNREGTPVGFALGEYTPNLTVTSTKDETYTVLGETYVKKDGHAKAVTITSDSALERQMNRRMQAEVVAGCYDVDAAAVTKGCPPPTGDCVRAQSAINYVHQDPATGNLTVKSTKLYASPQGQLVQITAMREFRERYPHVSAPKCANIIDVGVQRDIANLKMRGYTADAAVWFACKKSPENYSLSLVEGAGSDGTNGGDGGNEEETKTKKQRTAEDTNAAQARLIEQQKKQIENLKAAKGRVATNPQAGTQNVNGARPLASVTCPADVCRDFNFKAGGCTKNPCNYKHICAACGQTHPARGNH